MSKNPTAPSNLARARRAAAISEAAAARTAAAGARQVATTAREAAEDEPRPSLRGRPRRCDDSAALYCLSVRLVGAEREHVQQAACAAGLSVSDYLRLQVLGTTKNLPAAQVIEIPSQFDHDHVRRVAVLANLTNQLARAWNTAIRNPGFTREETASLRRAADALVGTCHQWGYSEAPSHGL